MATPSPSPNRPAEQAAVTTNAMNQSLSPASLTLPAPDKRPVLLSKQTGPRRHLAGVFVASLQPVRDRHRGAHFLEGERADAHPRVERDRHPPQVAQLHRRRPDPAG